MSISQYVYNKADFSAKLPFFTAFNINSSTSSHVLLQHQEYQLYWKVARNLVGEGGGHAPCTLPLHPLLDGPELRGSIWAVVYGISFINWYNMENWPLSSKNVWIIWSNVESSHAMSYPTDVFWSTIKLWWFSLLKRDCVATLFLGSITSDVSP